MFLRAFHALYLVPPTSPTCQNVGRKTSCTIRYTCMCPTGRVRCLVSIRVGDSRVRQNFHLTAEMLHAAVTQYRNVPVKKTVRRICPRIPISRNAILLVSRKCNAANQRSMYPSECVVYVVNHLSPKGRTHVQSCTSRPHSHHSPAEGSGLVVRSTLLE